VLEKTFIPGKTLERLLQAVTTDYLVIVREEGTFEPCEPFFRRMEQVSTLSGGGCLYCDYRLMKANENWEDGVLPAYQFGSVRDTFPMGPLVVLRMESVRRMFEVAGPLMPTRWGGLVDVISRLARRDQVVHIPEMIINALNHPEDPESGHFDYIRKENQEIQNEMERLFNGHLRRIGAWLPERSTRIPNFPESSPIPVSVVIPVRNRAHTIGQAIKSAATQTTDFPYNILVVDNYSTDGTPVVIEEMISQYPNIRRLVPPLQGRGIGGCWQLAISSEQCGRFAVQLDSDDLYDGDDALQKMVDCLRSGPHAMVVGAYRVVDEKLNEIPPGIVDHREWTRQNGHNNLLRVEGIGAPRGFYVPLLRRVGFPDVSYGEDYAVSLALSRRFSVGRIFDPIYLCRRWAGNTDRGLTPAQTAANHEYKDFLRSMELRARIKQNEQTPE